MEEAPVADSTAVEADEFIVEDENVVNEYDDA